MMQLRFYCNLAKLSNNEIGAQSTDFKFKSQIATLLCDMRICASSHTDYKKVKEFTSTPLHLTIHHSDILESLVYFLTV